MGQQGDQRRAIRDLRAAHRRQGGAGHQHPVGQRRQLDQPDAVRGGRAGPAGPPAAAERLYAVVARPAGPTGATADIDQELDTTEGWWLVGLDPEGLEVESARAVSGPLRRLAVAPDGRQAYAFAPAGGPGLGSALVAVDLATGTTADLGKRVPGQGLAGLAVTDERVYVPLPDGAEVWVGDRQGHPLGVVPVGRRPFAIALGRRRHVSSRSRALAGSSRRAMRRGRRGTEGNADLEPGRRLRRILPAARSGPRKS